MRIPNQKLPAKLTQKLHLTRCLLAVAAFALSTSVHAVHMIDGVFGTGEWTVSAVDPAPARATVSRSAFTVSGVPNAGILYAEQSNNGIPASGSLGNKLELFYDCTICGAPLTANAALDVFFQSGADDYVVHVFSIFGTPIYSAFEKATGTLSPLNPDGSLDLTSPVWTALDAADLAFAQFVVGVGFGPSPNSANPHYTAEFQLSVNNAVPGDPSNGLYSPEPAFWSASTNRNGFDFPHLPNEGNFPVKAISSAIFTLNSDGSTTVNQVLGPNGEPITQQVPEPETLTLMLAGVGAMGFMARRKRVPHRRSLAAIIKSTIRRLGIRFGQSTGVLRLGQHAKQVIDVHHLQQ